MKNIPFKSKLSRYRNIENRNKAFDALSAKDKRREIAYEGLKLVLTTKLNASCGVYWSEDIHKIREKAQTSKELQNGLLKTSFKSCEVCQRGLMMVSQIRLSNGVDPNAKDVEMGEGSKERKGFSLSSFRDMEREFESRVFSHPYRPNSNKKLVNICCNIINNGDFNILDTTDYLEKWDIKLPKNK